MTQEKSIKILGDDFLAIQKIVKKMKSDGLRIYLDQVKIKTIDDEYILLSLCNGHFMVNKKIKVLSNDLKEDVFVCFESIKNIKISKSSIIEITKEHLKDQWQQYKIEEKGNYPDIEKLQSNSRGEKISLDFKILENFKPLLVDNILNLSLKEIENHIEVSTQNGEVLGIIMAIKNR